MILHFCLSLIHVFSQAFFKNTGKTVNNYIFPSIRYIQQKCYPLMSFENNSILQKWHTLQKMPRDYFLLNLLYDSHSRSWNFKVEFFRLQSDIPITVLCLIAEVGSISRMLVVLQKANNVVVRCYFCEMLFMLDAIFGRLYFWEEDCPFCNTMSMGAISVKCF